MPHLHLSRRDFLRGMTGEAMCGAVVMLQELHVVRQ